VQHLVLDGSLDARMAQLIVEKQEIADRALDRSTDVAIKGIVRPRPESDLPPVPLWKKVLLKEALLGIARRVGSEPETIHDDDGRGEKVGHGFSNHDVPIGNKLANYEGTFSDRQAHVALNLCQKYRRQLPEAIRRQLEIHEPAPSKKERRTQMKLRLSA
jgi:hypothetical protein